MTLENGKLKNSSRAISKVAKVTFSLLGGVFSFDMTIA